MLVYCLPSPPHPPPLCVLREMCLPWRAWDTRCAFALAGRTQAGPQAPCPPAAQDCVCLVSTGAFRGVCKKIDHFPEDADYEQDTAEYLLRKSPLHVSPGGERGTGRVPCPRPVASELRLLRPHPRHGYEPRSQQRETRRSVVLISQSLNFNELEIEGGKK